MSNDDSVIDRLIVQRDRLLIENEKLKKALASSCDEQRHEFWEAGPGIGGCERAVDAEREVESLTKALAQCREVFPFIDPPSNLALEAVAFPESVPKYVAEEVNALRAEIEAVRSFVRANPQATALQALLVLDRGGRPNAANVRWAQEHAARAEAKPADTHVTEHHVKALKQQMRADPQYALKFLVEAGIANPDGTLTEHYRAEKGES